MQVMEAVWARREAVSHAINSAAGRVFIVFRQTPSWAETMSQFRASGLGFRDFARAAVREEYRTTHAWERYLQAERELDR
jgi:hypothetical protein